MVLLGDKIKELRAKFNLTQAQLAERIGVSTGSVTSYESNVRQPSFEVLLKMSAVFKVTIDSLILNRNDYVIDVSGLKPEQIDKIQGLVDYMKDSILLEVVHSDKELDADTINQLIAIYPNLFNKEKINAIKDVLDK